MRSNNYARHPSRDVPTDPALLDDMTPKTLLSDYVPDLDTYKQKLVRGLLKRLPTPQRRLLVWYYYRGLTQQQIADKLSIHQTSAYYRLTQAAAAARYFSTLPTRYRQIIKQAWSDRSYSRSYTYKTAQSRKSYRLYRRVLIRFLQTRSQTLTAKIVHKPQCSVRLIILRALKDPGLVKIHPALRVLFDTV